MMPKLPDLSSFPNPARAVVVGATGGIGRALFDQLNAKKPDLKVTSFARRTQSGMHQLDITDTRSIDESVDRLRAEAPLHLCLIATGELSSTRPGPEKSNSALSLEEMTAQFLVNSAGPALLAARLAPLLDRNEKSVIGILSARVGSISDNRLGGWHSYRASKSALNMLIKTIAIDLARSHKKAVCVGLHPGTVNTALSRPFQRNVATSSLFTPEIAARNLLTVINTLSAEETGRCFDYAGQAIAP